VRIYLDACCLNRLTDDQSQPRVAAEAETNRNPEQERRHEVGALLLQATETISLDSGIIQGAQKLETLGYGAFDALHLSPAESGFANVLLTTDDRFIKRASRAIGSPRVRVLNPVEWLREQGA
jgi:hypothetical protein